MVRNNLLLKFFTLFSFLQALIRVFCVVCSNLMQRVLNVRGGIPRANIEWFCESEQSSSLIHNQLLHLFGFVVIRHYLGTTHTKRPEDTGELVFLKDVIMCNSRCGYARLC